MMKWTPIAVQHHFLDVQLLLLTWSLLLIDQGCPAAVELACGSHAITDSGTYVLACNDSITNPAAVVVTPLLDDSSIAIETLTYFSLIRVGGGSAYNISIVVSGSAPDGSSAGSRIVVESTSILTNVSLTINTTVRHGEDTSWVTVSQHPYQFHLAITMFGFVDMTAPLGMFVYVSALEGFTNALLTCTSGRIRIVRSRVTNLANNGLIRVDKNTTDLTVLLDGCDIYIDGNVRLSDVGPRRHSAIVLVEKYFANSRFVMRRCVVEIMRHGLLLGPDQGNFEGVTFEMEQCTVVVRESGSLMFATTGDLRSSLVRINSCNITLNGCNGFGTSQSSVSLLTIDIEGTWLLLLNTAGMLSSAQSTSSTTVRVANSVVVVTSLSTFFSSPFGASNLSLWWVNVSVTVASSTGLLGGGDVTETFDNGSQFSIIGVSAWAIEFCLTSPTLRRMTISGGSKLVLAGNSAWYRTVCPFFPAHTEATVASSSSVEASDEAFLFGTSDNDVVGFSVHGSSVLLLADNATVVRCVASTKIQVSVLDSDVFPLSSGWLVQGSNCSNASLASVSKSSLSVTDSVVHTSDVVILPAGLGVTGVPTTSGLGSVQRIPRANGPSSISFDPSLLQWLQLCTFALTRVASEVKPARHNNALRLAANGLGLATALSSATCASNGVMMPTAVMLRISIWASQCDAGNVSAADDEDLPLSGLMDNPLHFQVAGVSAQFVFAAGAVVGNIIVLGGWICGGLIVHAVLQLRSTGSVILSDYVQRLLTAGTLIPLLLTPYSFLFQPSLTGAVSLLVDRGGTIETLVGVVGVLLWSTPIVVMSYKILSRFQFLLRPCPKSISTYHSRVRIALRWLMARTAEWEAIPNDTLSKELLLRFVSLFDSLRRGHHWNFVVDFAYAAIVAAIVGVSTAMSGTCLKSTSVLWALAACALIFCFLSLRLPHTSRFENFNYSSNAIISVVVVVLCALEWNEAADDVSVLQGAWGLLLALGGVMERLLSWRFGRKDGMQAMQGPILPSHQADALPEGRVRWLSRRESWNSNDVLSFAADGLRTESTSQDKALRQLIVAICTPHQ